MFCVALCDDNEDFLKLEDLVVHQYMEQKHIDCQIEHFKDGEALLLQSVENYDLVLLDVEMGKSGGIETARKIRKYSEVPIAFVTAHLSYSLEGYKVNAIRYVLKDKDNFSDGLRECLDTVLYQKKNDRSKQYLLEAREGKIQVRIENLVYVESHRHYCYYHIRQSNEIQVYSIREKLDEIEERFQSSVLVSIHKSYLVNLSYVCDMKRYQMQLSSGESLMIAQPRYLGVEKAYLDYCGRIDGDRE